MDDIFHSDYYADAGVYDERPAEQPVYQPGNAYVLDGLSDDSESTDDIITLSPSPRERISSYPQHNDPKNTSPTLPRGYRANRVFLAQFPRSRPVQAQSQLQTPTPPRSTFNPIDFYRDSHPRAFASSQSLSRNREPQRAPRLYLRPVSDLPEIYRSMFKFDVFNAVQSSCFDGVLHSDENIVISAPTGSGKTVVFELSIIKMLSEAREAGRSVKCVYVAPTKALCSERYRDWAAKFNPLGATCCELTGDTVQFGKSAWGNAKSASVIITTGEKWDSLTRHWDDHNQTLSQIQLFLVDEIHILNESRGSTLEVVVSRMKLRGTSVRFVFVSATAPNVQDIANWIGRESTGPAKVYEFGEEFRPCKLIRHVVGFPRNKNHSDFMFDKNLDYKLFSTLRTYSVGKPILIFVATRKGVFDTAEQLAKDYNEAIAKNQTLPWTQPGPVNRIFNDKRLTGLVSLGIGVHHAGLSMDDRRAVEELFLNKILRVVVATTTLAVGVNLPAHTVVLKGVHMFQNSTMVEYSDLDIVQMLGRAGRPQFDKDGVAIIMCETQLENKYRTLIQGQTLIESSLHTNLSEHLNSEIGLGTITNITSAKEWLKSSFLFQRIQQNPGHYSLGKDDFQTWEERVDDIVMESVKSLKESELIVKDEGSEAIASTEYGDIMSKFYIRQKTMALILKLPERATMREVLEVVAAADEFSDSRLRSSEKTIYNKLRRHNAIRFEVKKVERTSDKIFILIQAVLGGISLNLPEYKSSDSQPQLEVYSVFRHLSRIARAIVEVAIVRKFGAPLKYALELARCFNAKAWEDRPVVLRQIEFIGEKSMKVLIDHGITTIPILRKQDSLRLELLLNRKPPFGLEMLTASREFPSYNVKIEEICVCSDKGRTPVDVQMSIECGLAEELGPGLPKFKIQNGRTSQTTSVLTLTSDYQFLDFRRISTKQLKEPKTFEVCATLDKPNQSVIVYVSSESHAGVTVMKSHKPNISPSEFPMFNTKPMTALELELQGLQDCEGLFDVDDMVDKYGDEIVVEEQNPPPLHFKNLRKTSTRKTRDPVNSHSVSNGLGGLPPKTLTSGSYECNHPCKGKLSCGHLCCRKGLPCSPKFHPANFAVESTKDKPQTQTSFNSYVLKPANGSPNLLKSSPKSKPRQTDSTLDNLRKLRTNTNDQNNNLKKPLSHQIELEPTMAKRKKEIPPNFDRQISSIANTDADKDNIPEDVDELPAYPGILTSTKNKRKYSSDDSSDSELDALIRNFPSADSLFAGNQGTSGRGGQGTKEVMLNSKGEVPAVKKVKMDTKASNPVEHQTWFLADSDAVESVPGSGMDSHDDIEIIDGPLPVKNQDNFNLNDQYYITTPATPNLTTAVHSVEEDDELNDDSILYAPIQQSLDFARPQPAWLLGNVDEKIDELEEVAPKDVPANPMAMEEEDDEFAALEAWLDENTV